MQTSPDSSSSRCPVQQHCRSLGTLSAPTCHPAMSPVPWQPELHVGGTAQPQQFLAPAPHQGTRGRDLQHTHPSFPNGVGMGTAPLEQPVLLGELLGKAGVRCGCSQHLLCPGCSHPALGSPCMAQHLPAPLQGTQAQMGPAPVPEASSKGHQPFLRAGPKTPSLEEEP